MPEATQGQCEAQSPTEGVSTPKPEVTQLSIHKHSNGYTVNGYGFGTKVSITLEHALDFIKDEFDS